MEHKVHAVSKWLGTGSLNIFGMPFSGKDTQGEILAELLGGFLIAGGDILRSHHDPKKIEEILAAGGIIPSDFYLELLLPYLSRPAYKERPLILSAVGRSHGEESIIIRAADESGHPVKAVIYLKIDEAEVWQRFKVSQTIQDRGNRSDDRREVLNNRITKFQAKTKPVIEYYRDKGLLLEVDGTLSKENVTSSILDKIISQNKL